MSAVVWVWDLAASSVAASVKSETVCVWEALA